MRFQYTKNIRITIFFEAPLLGYDVIKVYKPHLEKRIKELILNHTSEGIYKEVDGKGHELLFEVTDNLKGV